MAGRWKPFAPTPVPTKCADELAAWNQLQRIAQVLFQSGMGSLSPLSDANVTSDCKETIAEATQCEASQMRLCKALDIAVVTLDLPAVALNLVVLFIAFRNVRRQRGSDTIHILIGSMTLGDLLFAAISNPIELIGKYTQFYYRPGPCHVSHYASWLGLTASGMSLSLMNADKLLYFKYPLRYDLWVPPLTFGFSQACSNLCLVKVTRGRALGVVALCWASCVVFVYLVLWHAVEIQPHEGCSLDWGGGTKNTTSTTFLASYITASIAFCFVPVGSSAFLSAYLFVVTRKQRNAIAAGSPDARSLAQRMRSLVFIFVTTAWTTCSLLPFRSFNLLRLAFPSIDSLGQCHLVTYVGWLLYYLILLNPIINPLITVTIYHPYRRTLAAAWKSHCSRKRGPKSGSVETSQLQVTSNGGEQATLLTHTGNSS